MGETVVGPRPFAGRAFVSMLNLFAFAVLALSGLVMYFWPHGRRDLAILGLDRGAWQSVHIVLSWVVVVVAAAHLVLNWGAVRAYLGRRRAAARAVRREWLVALGVVLLTVAGAAARVPPFSLLVPEHQGPPGAGAPDAARPNNPD